MPEDTIPITIWNETVQTELGPVSVVLTAWLKTGRPAIYALRGIFTAGGAVLSETYVHFDPLDTAIRGMARLKMEKERA